MFALLFATQTNAATTGWNESVQGDVGILSLTVGEGEFFEFTGTASATDIDTYIVTLIKEKPDRRRYIFSGGLQSATGDYVWTFNEEDSFTKLERTFSITANSGETDYNIAGTSFSVSIVPLPPSLLVFLSALVGLAGFRRLKNVPCQGI